jgi:hypothetical protein
MPPEDLECFVGLRDCPGCWHWTNIPTKMLICKYFCPRISATAGGTYPAKRRRPVASTLPPNSTSRLYTGTYVSSELATRPEVVTLIQRSTSTCSSRTANDTGEAAKRAEATERLALTEGGHIRLRAGCTSARQTWRPPSDCRNQLAGNAGSTLAIRRRAVVRPPARNGGARPRRTQ